MFRVDLCIMKQILDVENEIHGKIIAVHAKREKVPHLVYCIVDIIVYVTCDPGTDGKKIPEISDKIQELISGLAIA